MVIRKGIHAAHHVLQHFGYLLLSMATAMAMEGEGAAMAMALEGRKPHVVAIPLPLSGHITALLQLCRILANSGTFVTFLNTRQNHAKFASPDHPQENPNIHFASIEPDAEPKSPPASPGWGFFRSFLARIDDLEAPARRFLSAAYSPLKHGQPDLILSDVYIGWAQDLAAHLGIPRVALWTSSASECLVYHYVPTLIARSILPFKVPEGCSAEAPDTMIEGIVRENPPVFHRVAAGSVDDIEVDIPGLPLLRRGEFPSFLQVEDGDDIIFHGYVKQASRMAEADIVLLNTFYGLETQVIEELKKEMRVVVPIGPLFLMDEPRQYSDKEGGHECLEWLDKQLEGSVVYIAFGSMIRLTESQVGEIASGLEACGQPFLWSLLKGSAPLPEGFVERCKDQGIVVSWAPQTQILGHPSNGAFLSHCGWNSSLESLALGVPMLCCPRGGDQILNAKMIVEEWGLGLGLATRGSFLTAEGLASAVKQLLHDHTIDDHHDSAKRGASVRAKAQALRQVVCKVIDSTTNVDSNVDNTLYNPSSQEALNSLLEFIATHS